MVMGRPKRALELSSQEREQSFARSRSLPASLSLRARIVLASAQGEANSSICQRFKASPTTVRKWRTRFIELRVKGLYDDLRPGRPRSIDDEALAGLINTTLHTKPADGATHSSVRTAGEAVGMSKSSVARYFKMFGLQPHRQECAASLVQSLRSMRSAIVQR